MASRTRATLATLTLILACAPHVTPQTLVLEEDDAPLRAVPSCSPPLAGSAEWRHAFNAGWRDAEHDLSRGVLALERYGEPALCRYAFAAVLAARLRVEYREVGACRVSEVVDGHATGYNGVMRDAIRELRGAEALFEQWQAYGCG